MDGSCCRSLSGVARLAQSRSPIAPAAGHTVSSPCRWFGAICRVQVDQADLGGRRQPAPRRMRPVSAVAGKAVAGDDFMRKFSLWGRRHPRRCYVPCHARSVSIAGRACNRISAAMSGETGHSTPVDGCLIVTAREVCQGIFSYPIASQSTSGWQGCSAPPRPRSADPAPTDECRHR